MRYSDYIKSVHFKHKSISYNLLTKKGPPIWHPASELMLNTVNKLNNYCINKQLDISNISMIYSLSNNNILTTISGSNNITEINNNLNCLNKSIDKLILQDINNIIYPIKNKLWGPEEDVFPVYKWDYI